MVEASVADFLQTHFGQGEPRWTEVDQGLVSNVSQPLTRLWDDNSLNMQLFTGKIRRGYPITCEYHTDNYSFFFNTLGKSICLLQDFFYILSLLSKLHEKKLNA